MDKIAVTPFVGVWIEIVAVLCLTFLLAVTPFVGVWIEMTISFGICVISKQSLPSWECGLKYVKRAFFKRKGKVTPFVGVWIEISFCRIAWVICWSLPSWECGLKYSKRRISSSPQNVTPFVGVWIEIFNVAFLSLSYLCHSLRGSVD